MAALDKLLKYLTSRNIAESLDDEKLKDIAEQVIKGYEIDEESRADWLEINKEAMELIKHCEKGSADDRDGLYEGQAKLIFPLLAPATIQLASRLITHIVRNDKAVEFKVLGKDYPMQDPQTGEPIPGLYVKAEKARKVSEYMNYELLIESDTWLKDTHKLMHIVAGWGIGFKQVYYDYISEKNISDVISPENVVINHKVSCLEKAPRVTVKHYLTKNEIIEFIRAGYFLDLDLEQLAEDKYSNEMNDSREEQPVHEFLCQTCYLDLDDDDYLEPYKVYVHKQSEQVFCIVPAFEYEDIKMDSKGKVLRISRRLDIVDFHAIDDPEGGYYSIGLNYLLLHPNKALTAIQRQLIDAGTLSNAAAVSGFVTKAFKTKERSIRVSLGEFQVLDCNPTVDPSKQIIPMPMREPSQTLLNMFQILIDVSKNQGFINDILTGDVEMQNVPATTTLAMTEQATRAFKPIIQKLYISLKKEFKLLFHLHAKHLVKERYVNFQDDEITVNQDDFDEESLDICPVADPTMSSEAVKFGRARALVEGLQVFGSVTNLQQAALTYYTDMGFNDPQSLVQQQQQQPDPKAMEVQLKAQIAQQEAQFKQAQLQLQAQNQQAQNQIKMLQMQLKAGQQQVKGADSAVKRAKTISDAQNSQKQVAIQAQQVANDSERVDIERQKLAIEQDKVDVARIAANNKPKGNSA